MAWVGLIVGTIAGILASVVGYTLWSLPLWLSLSLYPLAGSASAMLVIAILFLRRQSARAAPGRSPARSDLRTVR